MDMIAHEIVLQPESPEIAFFNMRPWLTSTNLLKTTPMLNKVGHGLGHFQNTHARRLHMETHSVGRARTVVASKLDLKYHNDHNVF